jgi:hypothetical protein
VDTGVSSASWTIPNTVADGSYEFALMTKCRSASQGQLPALPGVDSSISPIEQGIIDRTEPVTFGLGTVPSDNKYMPWQEISITFNENIDCSRPYKFSASLTLATTPAQTLQTPSSLLAYCSDNTIYFEMASTVTVSV